MAILWLLYSVHLYGAAIQISTIALLQVHIHMCAYTHTAEANSKACSYHSHGHTGMPVTPQAL